MVRKLLSFLLIFTAQLLSAPAFATWEKAIESGDVREVRKLLEAGENVNIKLDRGRTPLFIAAIGGNRYMVDALLKSGADVNAKDSNGETAIMVADNKNHVDIVHRLLAAGADSKGVAIKGSKNEVPPIVIDASDFRVDQGGLQAAAVRAFLERGWLVISREPQRVVGSQLRREGRTEELRHVMAEIRLEPPYIVIGFDQSYGWKEAWLQNLEQNMLIELEVNTARGM